MMMKMFSTLFVLSLSLAVALAYGEDFATIDASCTDAAGTPQSPIAVDNAAFDPSLTVVSSYTASQYNIAYTAYSWVASGFTGTNQVQVTDSQGSDTYLLESVSFKWGGNVINGAEIQKMQGSEHTWAKNTFVGEMQIKHRKGASQFMMVSVLFKLSPFGLPTNSITEMTSLTDLLDGSSAVAAAPGNTLDLSAFVNTNVNGFKYSGTFTSPVCAVTDWIVSTDIKYISSASLDKMKLQLANNLRPKAMAETAFTGRTVVTNVIAESVAYINSISTGYQHSADTASTLDTSIILFFVYFGIVCLVGLYFLPPLIRAGHKERDPKLQAALMKKKTEAVRGPAQVKEEQIQKEKRTVRIHVDPEEDEIEMQQRKHESMTPVMETMKEDEEEEKEEEEEEKEEEKEEVNVEDVVVA